MIRMVLESGISVKHAYLRQYVHLVLKNLQGFAQNPNLRDNSFIFFYELRFTTFGTKGFF